MNLTPPLQLAMTQINRALMVNDQEALIQALQSVPLPELLSQDTIEKVRARGKSALVIFLSTLAVSNEVQALAAQHWLDCYQSIVQKQMAPSMAVLPEHHVLRTTLQVLGQAEAYAPLPQTALSGQPLQWAQAFELAIDHKRWAWAQELLARATPKILKGQQHRQAWVMFSKSLAKRHNIFVDNSGQTHVDTDYGVLAQLFERCKSYLGSIHQTEAAVAAAYLQAKCLEAAQQYSEACSVLQDIVRMQPSEFESSLINRARCECKRGDGTQAIATLDAVVARKVQTPATAFSVTPSAPADGSAPEVPAGFDVAKASAALADLAQIFQANDIPFFLVSGTLLGYAREGQLLKHDKDIDVGVLGWEQQYKIGMALQKSTQFALSADFLKGSGVYYVPISHNATGVIIDLFFYHEDHGKYVTGVDFFFGYRQTFAFSPFKLKAMEFLGVPMFVPEDTELKLRENFGDWRTPDPGYISHLEAPCTVDPGGYGHMMTARLQLLNALRGNKPHKVRRIVQILKQHPDSAWAMDPALLQRLDALPALAPSQAGAVATAAEPQELAHV